MPVVLVFLVLHGNAHLCTGTELHGITGVAVVAISRSKEYSLFCPMRNSRAIFTLYCGGQRVDLHLFFRITRVFFPRVHQLAACDSSDERGKQIVLSSCNYSPPIKSCVTHARLWVAKYSEPFVDICRVNTTFLTTHCQRSHRIARGDDLRTKKISTYPYRDKTQMKIKFCLHHM